MKIKKIKIISSIYDVKYVKKLVGERNNKLLGHIDWDLKLIEINNSKYPIHTQLKTMMHEIVHGINKENNFFMPEKKVELLSNGIFALMLDNKEFIREILKLK